MSVNRCIPNVDDVRRRYMFGVWDETEDTSGDTNAEFFRFLDQRDAEVAKAERERIIKLIKAQDKWNDHFWFDNPETAKCDCYGCEDVQRLISLIKGENK